MDTSAVLYVYWTFVRSEIYYIEQMDGHYNLQYVFLSNLSIWREISISSNMP